jgi:hypothetical protein
MMTKTIKDYLRWSDVGFTQVEKTFPYLTGDVRLRASHFEAWQRDPEGVWEILSVQDARRRITYRLGEFVPLATARPGYVR